MGLINGYMYFEAKMEMERIRNSITPLAAILLVTDLSHPEIVNALQEMSNEDIERFDARLNIVFRLLENQKIDYYRSKEYFDSLNSQFSYEETFCDFKEVMKILGRSKGTVESYINSKVINVSRDKKGGKRKFFRDEIMSFSNGMKKI